MQRRSKTRTTGFYFRTTGLAFAGLLLLGQSSLGAEVGNPSDQNTPSRYGGTSAGNMESGQTGEGPGFITEEESAAETLRRMRAELQLDKEPDPPVSAGQAARSLQSRRAILDFQSQTVKGYLALPLRKIQIRAEDGLHELSMQSVTVIQFLTSGDDMSAENSAGEQGSQETGGPHGFDSEAVHCIVEHASGKIQGLCRTQPWKQLSMKIGAEHYRALEDHCLRDCEETMALKEIRFQNPPTRSLGGSL
ncbi:MAG: hypothetical protein KDK25_13995 [Leptospiraceae bacterium]|nr:hypothetical protein [Leptospiraceae bacterium]MCB1171452.1 hypothetical protein [Leptospiraceae bacterium]